MLSEDILSTFHIAGRPSVNFSQLSIRSGKLLSSPINFPCDQKTFCKLLSTFRWRGDFPKTSISFLLFLGAAKRLSENFQQLPSKLGAARRLFVYFHQLPSSLGEARKLSVNFPNGWETFHHFRQICVQPGDTLSISVKFGCVWGTFCKLLSPFCAAGRPSVNFCQLCLQTGDLL